MPGAVRTAALRSAAAAGWLEACGWRRGETAACSSTCTVGTCACRSVGLERQMLTREGEYIQGDGFVVQRSTCFAVPQAHQHSPRRTWYMPCGASEAHSSQYRYLKALCKCTSQLVAGEVQGVASSSMQPTCKPHRTVRHRARQAGIPLSED